MTAGWNSENTIKFIREFRANEVLWNRKSPSFKIKLAKEAALQSIADKMNIEGFGVEEVKRKMRTLKSTYYQEKKKIQISLQSGAEGDALYLTNLPWYQEMGDLLTSIHESQSLEPSFRPSLEPDNLLPQILFEDEEIKMECQDDAPAAATAAAEPIRMTALELERRMPKRRRTRSVISEPHHSPPQHKRRTTEDNEKNSLTDFVEQLQHISNCNSRVVGKDDCYDSFGKYVSSMLRTMGPPIAMRLQEKITLLLTNAMCPPTSSSLNQSTSNQ